MLRVSTNLKSGFVIGLLKQTSPMFVIRSSENKFLLKRFCLSGNLDLGLKKSIKILSWQNSKIIVLELIWSQLQKYCEILCKNLNPKIFLGTGSKYLISPC